MEKSEREELGHFLGTHRVLDDKKCLPQAAKKLDNSLPIFSNEILIEVNKLNIDAASFVQMENASKNDPTEIMRIVMENTQIRGKQENQVTGSGGILVGRVKQVGSQYRGPFKGRVGDEIASMVSLTLTPLDLKEIKTVSLSKHQMDVVGHAILFESSPVALIPSDIDSNVAMAVLDVAGAPAHAHHLCTQGNSVVVLGAGGKAGLLSCVAAREKVGSNGRLVAIEPNAAACKDLESLNICDAVLQLDATDPIAVLSGVEKHTRGKMGDVVISVVSAPNTEMGAVLSAKSCGKVLLFGMATSFSKAALGAEGVGSEATLIIGNGYKEGHVQFALDLLRKNPKLHSIFRVRYS